MMMLLGQYHFSVDTAAYQSKSRTTSYRWGKQERLAVDPGLQFVGPGDDSISIEGVVYPHYKGGLAQLERMREEAGKGRSLLLIEGTGTILGRWVIESISENQTEFTKFGTPKRVNFTMSLSKALNTRNTILNLLDRLNASRQNRGGFI
ncbi:phage tail protein [Paraneptunicella aestuarii]|uniref:phage tail protein n=1 Tax=Paraneptunicella aestuarii TaxID=2831148 RepID=UPI001E37DEBD|nr:phage tail protein [Paraneptunicella aestuarii]UAA38226.1 phage tail protein [Paraneptunicella aestuarii]